MHQTLVDFLVFFTEKCFWHSLLNIWVTAVSTLKPDVFVKPLKAFGRPITSVTRVLTHTNLLVQSASKVYDDWTKLTQ